MANPKPHDSKELKGQPYRCYQRPALRYNSTARYAQDAKHAKKDIVSADTRRSQLTSNTQKYNLSVLRAFAVP